MTAPAPLCAGCGKPTDLCLCDRLPSPPLPSRIGVLILQHPQENDAVLGTASIVARSLEGAVLRVGLSWASLGHAAGLERDESIDKKSWGLLFSSPRPESDETVVVTTPKGEPVDADARAAIRHIVVLDGTWSQAKTLYWRNAWLSRLPRLALQPREPSMYGKLRREPRREWVSTLEAVADTLVALGEPEETRAELRRTMRTMLQRIRDRPRAE